MERPSPDRYFMDMAELVATRSTCLRRHVGAVIVKDKHVLSTGYNGAPRGARHCEETGCLRIELNVPSGTRHELCRGVHAEQNAVAQAAYFGTSVKGATIYTTTFPCSLCAKILVNAGIAEIVYDEGYMDDLSKEILSETQMKIRRVEGDEIETVSKKDRRARPEGRSLLRII
ncbi:MAG: dCMP deaminase family protein [Candidatus Methanomethylophilus sp.]|jgi:dCMP deaminase|nr:dCMP deaminase family protein [Methanomethylophilus sp.]MCI2074837.1 dCMP deaminase family protein [Methanomethylophilus sp.]MCI2093525.1 dCMP deaminase family protein [Methanomethylophilus sp.]